MGDAEFENAHAALLSAIDETAGLLRHWGVDFWAEWLEQDRARIADGDRYGLDHLLAAFGGMGSLNDVLIHRMNGQDIDDEEARLVDPRLAHLREVIWSNASWIKRALEYPPSGP